MENFCILCRVVVICVCTIVKIPWTEHRKKKRWERSEEVRERKKDEGRCWGLAGWECGALSWRTCQGAAAGASLSRSSARVPGRCSCGPGSGLGHMSAAFTDAARSFPRKGRVASLWRHQWAQRACLIGPLLVAVGATCGVSQVTEDIRTCLLCLWFLFLRIFTSWLHSHTSCSRKSFLSTPQSSPMSPMPALTTCDQQHLVT